MISKFTSFYAAAAVVCVSVGFSSLAMAAPNSAGPIYSSSKISTPTLPSSDYDIKVISPDGKKFAGIKRRPVDSNGIGGWEGWVYNGSKFITIPVVGGVCLYAYYCEMLPTDINNNGFVVGYGKWGTYYTRGRAWGSNAGAEPQIIKATHSADWSYSPMLNGNTILFTARQWPTYRDHAFSQNVNTFTSNSGATDLGTLGSDSWGESINASGSEAAGTSRNSAGIIKGFSYKNGTMSELATVPSSFFSKAYYQKGSTVVGEVQRVSPGNVTNAAKWVNNVMTDLGVKGSNLTFGYYDLAKANFIFDNGDLAGSYKAYRRVDGGNTRAYWPFVYRNGKDFDLPKQISNGNWKAYMGVIRNFPNGNIFVSGTRDGVSGWYKLTRTN